MTPADLVEAALHRVVPAGVRVGARLLATDGTGGLVGNEASHVARAVDRRRREFAAGRLLLRELTGTSGAIGVLPNRAPDAPPGWAVSLAHDRELVAAVAAPRGSISALGVDMEPIGPLDDDMVGVVLRDDDADVDPLAAFVAKEAVYKAWSMPDRRILEFHDVRLRRATGGGGFTAQIVATDVDAVTIRGRLVQAADRWIAVCAMTRDER